MLVSYIDKKKSRKKNGIVLSNMHDKIMSKSRKTSERSPAYTQCVITQKET